MVFRYQLFALFLLLFTSTCYAKMQVYANATVAKDSTYRLNITFQAVDENDLVELNALPDILKAINYRVAYSDGLVMHRVPEIEAVNTQRKSLSLRFTGLTNSKATLSFPIPKAADGTPIQLVSGPSTDQVSEITITESEVVTSYLKELLPFNARVTHSETSLSIESGAKKDTQSLNANLSLGITTLNNKVGSSRVDLQACKLEYSIVSPK